MPEQKTEPIAAMTAGAIVGEPLTIHGLAKGAEKEQMGALAKDFFASFTGSSGARRL